MLAMGVGDIVDIIVIADIANVNQPGPTSA